MNGYIKLFRQLIEWEWYNDTNVKLTFIHLLLTVNFKDKKWKGITIKRGQLLTSPAKLGDAVGLSIQQIRTVFKKLKSTGEITIKTTNKNTLVTLVNFDVYQVEELKSNKQNNNQITNDQQTNNNQVTTTEESKELKNEEELKKKEKESVLLIEKFLEVVEHYQATTGQTLRIGKTNALILRSDKFKKIAPRLKAGATVEECKAVVELKNKQWKDNPKMKSNICIATLFRPSNFEKYLDEIDNSQAVAPKEKKFPYKLPNFKSKEQRHLYFLARYSEYKPHLEQRLVNTTYRQRAIMEKDAEGLCWELELKQPELLDIEIHFKV